MLVVSTKKQMRYRLEDLGCFLMNEYKSKLIIAVDDEEIVLSTLKMLLGIEGFENVETLYAQVQSCQS